MKLAQPGLDLIKRSEELRLKAYLDTGGVPTIGWGHTRGVRMGDTCTEGQAETYLREDTAEAVGAVNRLVKVPLTQNQFDALVSFTFNVGEGAMASSTLLRKLNAGDYRGAADQLERWVFDNGRKLGGLVTRRAAERELFLK